MNTPVPPKSFQPWGPTDYGFAWGPAEVTRCMSWEGGNVMLIKTPYQTIEVNVSPTGRSVRVFKGGKELTEGGTE